MIIWKEIHMIDIKYCIILGVCICYVVFSVHKFSDIPFGEDFFIQLNSDTSLRQTFFWRAGWGLTQPAHAGYNFQFFLVAIFWLWGHPNRNFCNISDTDEYWCHRGIPQKFFQKLWWHLDLDQTYRKYRIKFWPIFFAVRHCSGTSYKNIFRKQIEDWYFNFDIEMEWNC